MTAPHPYIPNTDDDRRAMLDVIGAATADQYSDYVEREKE
jgi:hypothetical protein